MFILLCAHYKIPDPAKLTGVTGINTKSRKLLILWDLRY